MYTKSNNENTQKEKKKLIESKYKCTIYLMPKNTQN